MLTLGMEGCGGIVVVEAVGGVPEESVCGGFEGGLGGGPGCDGESVVECVGEEDVLG
jgi:hypothetical protein